MEILQDTLRFTEDLMDLGECLLCPLKSWSFWILLITTLILKHKILLPRLEKYYKRKLAQRLEQQKRWLRTTLLEDSVLVQRMEESLLKQPDMDRQKMLQALQEIREFATLSDNNDSCGSSEGDKKAYTTKRQAKNAAALALVRITIRISMLLYLLYMAFGFHRAIQVSRDANNRFIWPSVCNTGGILDRLNVCSVVFCLIHLFCSIHLLHSFKILHDATAPKWRNNNNKTTSTSTSSELAASEGKDDETVQQCAQELLDDGRSDLEQPLLGDHGQ